MESKKLELVVFSVLFIGLTILVFSVFQPFLSILALGAVLSILFHPLYIKLVRTFPRGRSLVACFLVMIALVFLIIPILFFGLQIFRQAQGFFSLTQAGQFQYIQTIQQSVNLLIAHVAPGFFFNISDFISKITIFVSSNFSALLSQGAYIFFQTFFLLFSFFFFLRDGDKMLSSVVSLSPFRAEQNKEIINSVNRVVTSVIRGTLFVGLIRFVLFAAAFYLLGIPAPLLWASIGGIIGMVPGLGAPFVIVPAVLYLLLSGHVLSAIGMGIFGILLVILIDNMLSTYFFGKGLAAPSFLVLFSILGGIIFFGPLGFIFGPIILSLFISVVNMYQILVLQKS